ncbi:hypothetical protein [Chryseobacterium wanjuense]
MIISVFLYSCGNPEPQSTDFIGTWKSADGAHIILNPDGACILKDVDYFKISSFPQNKNSKLNAKGTWKFINNTESGIIDGLDSGINIIYKIPQQKLKERLFFIFPDKDLMEIIHLGAYLYGMGILMK